MLSAKYNYKMDIAVNQKMNAPLEKVMEALKDFTEEA